MSSIIDYSEAQEDGDGSKGGRGSKKGAGVAERGRNQSAPVPVARLAQVKNVLIRYEPFPGKLSGMLHRDGERVVIGVNALHPEKRKRFTIAHELGHLMLHKNEKLHVDSSSLVALRSELSSMAVDDHEIEANQFAAELLMPFEFLKRDIGAWPGPASRPTPLSTS